MKYHTGDLIRDPRYFYVTMHNYKEYMLYTTFMKLNNSYIAAKDDIDPYGASANFLTDIFREPL